MRFSLLSANVILLFVVASFVLQKPKTSGTTVSNAVLATQEESIANPLDQLSSADIAVTVARAAQLPEQVQIANHADTINAQLTVTPADDVVSAQPQIISTGLKSRADIKEYVVVEGDTVASVAQKFGVTSDTIKWSNGLTGDNLSAGVTLIISPVNGIVYTAKSTDTIDGLVNKYGLNKDRFVAINDLESGNLPTGQKIILPDATQPQVATTTSSRLSSAYTYSRSGFEAVYGYNGYSYGYCTWHAANRRAASGRPIPANLGNAISWYSRAQGAGFGVGSTPQAGAVLWHANLGGLGHVAYVESMNADGSILVSDMNYPSWGRVTYRTVSPGEFGSYRFIY
ncbi:LysM peptidoglycan-binding domain-containing protein [Candidatus Saccharibacteria bacterium]|nr:LysM peptidoglycan-binding domain-containing protein [Candidatus Saccharibacteria bacterium]